MNDTALDIRNLSKRFRLGQSSAVDRTIYESIRNGVRGLCGRSRGDRTAPALDFWALREINLRVDRGEAVGVIGPNGAGKSTLLKILSRITDPTHGRVHVRGRVASLLEVGTGFHPELTGRENIFLNGVILGMRRKQIKANFDRIVEFSGVEKFLQTPVKRYSSGMRVRLAFAVAAHLDPDILIVDEVLAVGDAAFQQKCIGRMNDVARSGRTVVLVSHNMGAVRSLCQRAVWLEDGQVQDEGESGRVVSAYLDRQNRGDIHRGRVTWGDADAPGGETLQLVEARLESNGNEPASAIRPQEPMAVTIRYRLHEPVEQIRVVVQIRTVLGEIAFTSTDQSMRDASHGKPGTYESTCHLPGGLLNQCEYVVRTWVGIPNLRQLVDVQDLLRFSVVGISNSGSTLGEQANWPGVVCPKLDWSIRSVATKAAA